MARSAVVFSVVITLTTVSQVWGACSDYTCAYNPPEGKSKVTMIIDSGDNCAYNTQAGDTYPPPRGVDCVVNYEHGSCTRMKFECDSLNLRNKDDIPWRCKGGKKGGDRMIIYGHNDGAIYRETRKYCRNRAPMRVRSTEGLKILRRTKGGQGGKNCSIKCLD